MCIAFFTTSQAGYKLIIAANRDEFYDRPAAPASWHAFDREDAGPSTVLSGRDLASTGGGTWMGMTRDMRLGLITNIRNPASAAGAAIRKPGAPSRGQLLRSFLERPPSSSPLTDFMNSISDLGAYDGFNLLLFTVRDSGVEVGFVSNRPEGTATILPARQGALGISNTPLDVPWPKVKDGQTKMEVELKMWAEAKETEDELFQRLMRLLRRSIEVKTILDAPNCTCIPPVLLAGRWYGTRVSTIILISDANEVTFVERDIGAEQEGVGSFVESEDRVFRFNGT